MLITDALLGEHGVFHLLFQDLEKAISTLESAAALTNRAAPLSFSLEAHASLEDELLFAALEPHLGTQGGPLAVMRMEHDQIVTLLGRIPSAPDLAQARALAAQMIEVSRGHFRKEEQVLFRMAQKFLDEETLSALGAKWSARRGPLITLETP